MPRLKMLNGGAWIPTRAGSTPTITAPAEVIVEQAADGDGHHAADAHGGPVF